VMGSPLVKMCRSFMVLLPFVGATYLAPLQVSRETLCCRTGWRSATTIGGYDYVR